MSLQTYAGNLPEPCPALLGRGLPTAAEALLSLGPAPTNAALLASKSQAVDCLFSPLSSNPTFLHQCIHRVQTPRKTVRKKRAEFS